VHASLLPSTSDLAGLFGYVLGNPYLFVSSSTVMTTGLVLGAVVVSLVPRGASALRFAAPSLALVLVYFGLGSMALATEILLRFHHAIPDATETQFASGVGHLLGAAAGISVLYPHLRRRSRREWIAGNAVAVAYWTAQVLILTPPWFAFAGQLELVRAFAMGGLGLGALVSAVLWRAAPRRR
jgi:hypothetical protein